ncbi:MAG: 16S rRNA (guanine(527)-N(7))-methyltransferase RsmG [Pseudomonadales bacterium]|nr:16S rRNA (guanine(527)-N(7))-methyltransferase RsmG [Pseudomonadales bacterium]
MAAQSKQHQLSTEQILALTRTLGDGCEALGLTLSDQQKDQLIAYLLILRRWNHVYNLTAVDQPEKMVVYHLLDSLSIAPYLQGDSIIDVGTGGGLPGIPLSIVFPDKQFTLLDSVNKKTRFLLVAVAELGLNNVTVVNTRVEKFVDQCFDTVVTRAFSSLELMLQLTGHLTRPSGLFMAMKGKPLGDEEHNLPEGFVWIDERALEVPGLDAERHLYRIEKKEV